MADTLDIITLTEAKTAINVSGTNYDTELALFITGLSRRIDEICGPVVVRTVTNEYHDGGKPRIWLRETPVDSVTTVVEWLSSSSTSLSAESPGTYPASGYLLDNVDTRYFLWRRSSNSDSTFADGRRNIVVTYEAGRYANTAAVDAKFKLAAASIMRRLWKRESSAWSQNATSYFPEDDTMVGNMRFYKAVDPMIRELLADEMLSPVGL